MTNNQPYKLSYTLYLKTKIIYLSTIHVNFIVLPYCHLVFFTIWQTTGQIVTLIIILSHTVVDIQFPPLQICSYRSPGWPLVGYILSYALPFTTNSTFLTTVNKNIYNKKFPNQLYKKSHNVCYIQSCYIADTCTERVTHFQLSSGRHVFFLSMSRNRNCCIIPSGFANLIVWSSCSKSSVLSWTS